MANLSLRFTIKNGRFCLCATVTGSTTRNYRTVDELLSPDMKFWDKRAQRFVSRRPVEKQNNAILSEMLAFYTQLQEAKNYPTGKELFANDFNSSSARDLCTDKGLEEVPQQKPKVLAPKSDKNLSGYTLRIWLPEIIESIKRPTRLKPSSSYQIYLTLLHKLEAEGRIIDLPLEEINDDTYLQLISWLRRRGGKTGKGTNYVGTMKTFTATLNRARKARLITYTPDFPYMDYAPTFNISDKAADVVGQGGNIKSLTPEQYAKFLALDLDEIRLSHGAKMAWYKELYRDFCVLLYELKSRPIDILRLHWDNIAIDPHSKRYTCTYIPAKKKNYGASRRHTSKALVIQYMSEKAVEIVNKYKGKSKGGYVFPFAINQTHWNINNPDEYHHYYYKGNHVCGQINRFLHKVGKYLKCPFQLTIYAFRRTAITQAIVDNKIPLPILAKMAGTSLEMIDAHYANYLQTMEAY